MKLNRNNSILSGSNFSNISDIIYSQFISKEEYEKKEINKNIILYKEKDYLLYKLLDFEIYENAVIFCNNLVLKSLFEDLNKMNNFSNINFKIFVIFSLASNLSIPTNSPGTFLLSFPFFSNIFINSSLCLFPISKSLKS